MRAPNPDGGGSTGSGYSTCSIVDNGPGGQNRIIYLDTLGSYKRGDTVVVTNAPILGGEYVVKFFLTPTDNTFVDDDGTTKSYTVAAGTSMIISTTLSTVSPDGAAE